MDIIASAHQPKRVELGQGYMLSTSHSVVELFELVELDVQRDWGVYGSHSIFLQVFPNVISLDPQMTISVSSDKTTSLEE